MLQTPLSSPLMITQPPYSYSSPQHSQDSRGMKTRQNIILILSNVTDILISKSLKILLLIKFFRDGSADHARHSPFPRRCHPSKITITEFGKQIISCLHRILTYKKSNKFIVYKD